MARVSSRARGANSPKTSPLFACKVSTSVSTSSGVSPKSARVRGMPSDTKNACNSSMAASTASATASSSGKMSGSTGSMPNTASAKSRKRSGFAFHTWRIQAGRMTASPAPCVISG